MVTVNSPHKGQWRGALIISLICAWINASVNNRKAGDLRRHRAHYDVIVMILIFFKCFTSRCLFNPTPWTLSLIEFTPWEHATYSYMYLIERGVSLSLDLFFFSIWFFQVALLISFAIHIIYPYFRRPEGLLLQDVALFYSRELVKCYMNCRLI